MATLELTKVTDKPFAAADENSVKQSTLTAGVLTSDRETFVADVTYGAYT